MNTDNMSIVGLTIDYGPYGWLEGYDPEWTPHTTDAEGRQYCYGNQPQIGLWNLARLAKALAHRSGKAGCMTDLAMECGKQGQGHVALLIQPRPVSTPK